MAYQCKKVQKVMVQPINLIFRYLQGRTRVLVWVYEAYNKRIEGILDGFDEFMNLVLGDAYELNIRTKSRRKLGRILLRGDAITLIHPATNSDAGGDVKEECQIVPSSSGI